MCTHAHTHAANPNAHSYPSSKEVTPLHIAAGSGHLGCLQLLVQLGGDIMARDTEQLTPVEYANINGCEPCFIYLLDALGTIDINLLHPHTYVSSNNNMHKSPMYSCMHYMHIIYSSKIERWKYKGWTIICR